MTHLSVRTHGLWILLLVRRGRLADHTTISSSASLMDIEGTVIKPEFGAVFGDQVIAGPFTVFQNCIIAIMSPLKGGAGFISRVVG